MSDNWVVQNLENALETWNEKLAEIWQLITTTPQDFKGGGIWSVIVNINGAVQSIGPVSYTHLDVYKRQPQIHTGNLTVEKVTISSYNMLKSE